MTFIASDFILKRKAYLDSQNDMHHKYLQASLQVKSFEKYYKSSAKITEYSDYHYRYYKVLPDKSTSWNEVIVLVYDYSNRMLTQKTISTLELLNINIYESTKEEFDKAINELLLKE